MNIAPNDTHIDSSNLQERFGSVTVTVFTALKDELQYHDYRGMHTRQDILASIPPNISIDYKIVDGLFDVLDAIGLLPYEKVGEMTCGMPIYIIKPGAMEEAYSG